MSGRPYYHDDDETKTLMPLIKSNKGCNEVKQSRDITFQLRRVKAVYGNLSEKYNHDGYLRSKVYERCSPGSTSATMG